MKRYALLAAALTLLALASPGPASAATVSVNRPPCDPLQSKYGQCYPDEARFVAEPGEVNRVTVSRIASPQGFASGQFLRFEDSGAAVHAGGGCHQVDEHTADCEGFAVQSNVSTGDADDTVDIGFSSVVDGGDGNDVIHAPGNVRGGGGGDTLVGGDFGDSLQGGTGSDRIAGGPGNDTIQPDDADVGTRDVVDGGSGPDVLSYENRASAVTISLDDTSSAEDAITGFEGLRGGAGADRLTGDRLANVLEGGEGSDELDGGGGADLVDGGKGGDRLDGGAGNDRLADGGGRDAATCGTGTDAVWFTGAQSTLEPDCERLDSSGWAYDHTLNVARLHVPLASARSSLVRVSNLDCFEFPCAIDLRVVVAAKRHRGAILGQRLGRYRRERGMPNGLALRLSPSGLRLLKRMHGTTARVTLALNENGERAKLSFLIRLDPPA